jgi:benzoate/toluate 1,2-dioxygenase alpha subunit
MQLENCSDQYHFTSTHQSLIRVLERRARAASVEAAESTFGTSDYWKGGTSGVEAGSYSFDGGHVVTWGRMPPSPSHALWDQLDALVQRFGEARADWMFNMRNLTLFPNMQLAVNASTQLRVIVPRAYNLTEMQTWCLVPRGESPDARRLRIHQYEDFFNPTGMAIADDNAVYEECQRGLAEQQGPWLQGHARGLAATQDGGDAYCNGIALKPARSVAGPSALGDETLFQSYYREWRKRMAEVLA